MSKHLPLIALVTLGVAACGGSDEVEVEDDEIVVDDPAMTTDDTSMTGTTATTGSSPNTTATGTMGMDEPMMGEEGDATVTVTVDGVSPDEGEVYVALQPAQGFLQMQGAYTETMDADGASVTVNFDGVAPGQYAVVAFQDTDGNGSLGMSGAQPSEPWGISGYTGTGRPQFQNAMVDVGEMGANAQVSLQGGQ